jgi:outer membrane protein assembly factor BamB
MRPRDSKTAAPVSLLLGFLTVSLALPLQAAPWPQWRGPLGTGVSQEDSRPPIQWGPESIRWKLALPERGNSTPIVWKDRVFLTQAEGAQRLLFCMDRKDGKILWKKGTTSQSAEAFHPTNTPCAASPVTDGQQVIANFGSAGVLAFDFSGQERWRVDLGPVDHQWGYAASPVLDGERCFVHFGPGNRHFLVALDKATGRELWRVDFPKVHPAERTDGFAGKQGEIGSWSTPILVNAKGRTELVVSLPGKLTAFDPATGRTLWSCEGLNPLLYTSAMAGEGVVIGSGGYGGSTIAVEPGGSGDVTAQRLWHKLRDKQRIGSGVIHRGHLYILNTPGTAQCIRLRDGETVWEQRLPATGPRSESWASMVLCGDHLYVNNQGGDVFVLKAAPTYELLAVNPLRDGIMNASVAISDGELFLRTEKHLWCVR